MHSNEQVETNSASTSNITTYNENENDFNNFNDVKIYKSNEQLYNRKSLEKYMYDKLNQLKGPFYDLTPIIFDKKKFSSQSRLYVGNISPKISEEDLKKLFEPYGETNDLFFNRDRSFAFIKFDYRHNAENAINDLNGKVIKGRTLKVRFGTSESIIKAKNLDEYVTNELLFTAFSIFGDIERCTVITNDKGKSIGEGLIEFKKKSSAKFAFQKCKDESFLLTSNIRPVIVEYYTPEEFEGYSEKLILKKGPDYYKARSIGPRFASSNTFEQQYAVLWKQLYELQKQKEDTLKQDFDEKRKKLERQTEMARYEHETATLREELRNREEQMEKQKQIWEVKRQNFENEKKRANERLKSQEDNYRNFIVEREYNAKRLQQVNNLYEGAYQLDYMLHLQEANYDDKYYSAQEINFSFQNDCKRKRRF